MDWSQNKKRAPRKTTIRNNGIIKLFNATENKLQKIYIYTQPFHVYDLKCLDTLYFPLAVNNFPSQPPNEQEKQNQSKFTHCVRSNI